MDKTSAITKKALQTIRLTEAEREKILSDVDGFIKKLRSSTEADVIVGGSFAKGTFLKDDFDCDVFVRFDIVKGDQGISDMLEKILIQFKPVRIHGSRDYFQLKYKGINFEIIPVVKIDSPEHALNVTDCSPIHVDWINSRIDKNPKLREEIILAKLFTKSVGVYGAESYIKGFSGHVLDILVSNYGSFDGLLKASLTWKNGHVIDIENHAMKMSKDKLGSLVVIDPIQKDRNAAAALSKEKMDLFINKAKEFLDKPSIEYFSKTVFVIPKSAIVIKAKPLEGKKDIIGCKLLKIYEGLQKDLKEFGIVESGWNYNHWNRSGEAVLFFMLGKKELPNEYIRNGPPISAKDNVVEFMKKHNETFIKGNRIFAKIKRDKTKILDVLKADLQKYSDLAKTLKVEK